MTDAENEPAYDPFGDPKLGMWIGSTLGYSYHCRCGWVSLRLLTIEAVKPLIIVHWRESPHHD